MVSVVHNKELGQINKLELTVWKVTTVTFPPQFCLVYLIQILEHADWEPGELWAEGPFPDKIITFSTRY